jgi:hypothetical protein
VYVPGSTLLAADRDSVAALTTSGAGPVTLRVVDRWPEYEVVRAADPGGPALRRVGGRGEAEVRMTVEATAEGWRIASAERVG